MKNNLLFYFLLLILNPIQGQSDTAGKRAALLQLMEERLSHEGKKPVHNFMLYAENRQKKFCYHGGAGIIGRNENPIDEDFQFNIASITKTYVAVVVLQLWEEGKLDLGDKAFQYLKDYEFLRMHEIHQMDGKSYGREITVRQLLRHTSGLGDFFTDTQTRFNLSVLLHKKREYTIPRMTNIYFKYKLHKKPHSLPGKGYHYSDMNYVLLGLVIENITGSTLHEQIRQRILQPLNMNNTYFIYYEPEHGHGKRIDSYLNRINITRKINTSYEWGGGGLVSTTRETAQFVQAIFDLKLYRKKETLDAMMDFTATKKYGGDYGLGISRYNIGDRELYGHGGFYGSLLLYDPKADITISVNVGQANVPFDSVELLNKILQLLE